MDLISNIVALLKPSLYMAPSLDIGGEWAIQFPPQVSFKFEAVVQGSCWIQVAGDTHARRLNQGDCFLLTAGRSFLAASDLSLPATDAHAIFTKGCDETVCYQGGGDTYLVGSRVVFAGQDEQALLRGLPPIVVCNADSQEAHALRSLLDLFVKEIRESKPGSVLSMEHHAHLMLIQMLRLHLNSVEPPLTGWWAALKDPQLCSSITAMHENLDQVWTLDQLAHTAAMSRSSFAERFRRVVGETPLEYLTQWRMRTAAQLLESTASFVLDIANRVGYKSESAFSTAFRSFTGQSPREFRKRHLLSVGEDAAVTHRSGPKAE